LAFTQFLLSSSSYHAHSSDQNHQKQSKFLLPFSKFFLFIIFNFLDFILCNDEINMLWKIKMVDEKGREMQMVEEGRKMKYEITTGLFSR
jgi:hypothetical protein